MLQPLPLSKARLEALTDGIFAVTMTLLVLDLKLPEPADDDVRSVAVALRAMLQQLDDYVVSFVVLCLFWLAHLRLLGRIRDPDATFTWLNFAFLLFTTFVPPLTSFVGHYPTNPIAAIAYGTNLLLILTCEALMWRRAIRRLINETVTDARALSRFVMQRYLFAAAVMVLAMTGALIEIELDERVALASYLYLLLIGVAVLGSARKPGHPAYEPPQTPRR